MAPSGASSNAPDASGSRADVVPADTAAATTALVNLQGAGDQEVAKLTAERDKFRSDWAMLSTEIRNLKNNLAVEKNSAETAEKKLEKAEKGLEKVVEEGERLKSNSERQAKQITALNYAQVKLRNENAKLKEERTEAQNTKKKLEREAKDLRGKNAVLKEDRKAEENRQQDAREEEDMRQKMLDAREQSFCEWERLLEQRERSLAERNTMNPGSHTQMSSEHIQQQSQPYPVGPNSHQFYAALETLRYCFHQNLNSLSWQEQQLRQSHQELEQRTQEDNNTIPEEPFRPIPASDNAASERRQSI